MSGNGRYRAKTLTFLAVASIALISSTLLADPAIAAHSAVAQCGKQPDVTAEAAVVAKWLDCERDVDLAELSRIARCKPPMTSPSQAEVSRCLGRPDAVDRVQGSEETEAWAYPELGAWIYVKNGVVTSITWLGGRS